MQQQVAANRTSTVAKRLKPAAFTVRRIYSPDPQRAAAALVKLLMSRPESKTVRMDGSDA